MSSKPLAAALRPTSLNDFYGQSHLLSEGKPLRQALDSGQMHSMILWGPPGTGKTTLANLLCQAANAQLEKLSAVLSGVKDIREVVARAQEIRDRENKATVLFVDEVHRFNKSQQDAFLPYVEDGTLTFIGATTENPSFALNNALLSRARVYVLKPLSDDNIKKIIKNALQHVEIKTIIEDEFLTKLVQAADGDARRGLNLVEVFIGMLQTYPDKAHSELLAEVLTDGYRRFDKGGEYFYDLISALHKSVRGSAPDAAVYWLTRLLDGGCDPLYVARRLIRMASEDIGNADPRALDITLNAAVAYERLGSPEGELALAQATLYLAAAAKSNAAYLAYNASVTTVKKTGSLEVPLHLRNAPTQLMKDIGYAQHYRYAHDEPNAYAVGENYLPEELIGATFYQPVSRGLEIKIQEKLNQLKDLDDKIKVK